MLLTQLVDVVPLHGSGSYMGYHFCGNFTGVADAAGQKVHCPSADIRSARERERARESERERECVFLREDYH